STTDNRLRSLTNSSGVYSLNRYLLPQTARSSAANPRSSNFSTYSCAGCTGLRPEPDERRKSW
ncbi:MAG: hypothetical protein ACREA0_09745, partial [bacterium]